MNHKAKLKEKREKEEKIKLYRPFETESTVCGQSPLPDVVSLYRHSERMAGALSDRHAIGSRVPLYEPNN